MDIKRIEGKLNELVQEVGGFSRSKNEKLTELAERTAQGHTRLKKTIDSLQESLDYLLVCIKYQLLDLEATKRENAYLKKMLESREEEQ